MIENMLHTRMISVWRLAAVAPVCFAFLGSVQAQAVKRFEQTDFGKTQDGVEVKLITLRNSKGMSARIITYGAIIKELHAPDRDRNFANILLTTDSLEKFQRGFNGAAAVIGRVANRIAGAQFELDGATHHLTPNERQNSIHGGRKGFAQSVWTVEALTERKGEGSVTLTYLSRDGEEGFPGNLKTSVTYSLTDKNELRIDYEASTDKPTIANLTNHAYWNLAGEGSCLDNILWIPSGSYTPTDADLIPTGEILPLKGTPMDFNQPTRIGDRIQELKPKMSGYDHNYILGEGNAMKMAARLVDPKSGRIMEVRTTQPAVQLYTANHLGHTGVCLETQHYPDAIHHKNFPSIVIRPGNPLKETTLFTFLGERHTAKSVLANPTAVVVKKPAEINFKHQSFTFARVRYSTAARGRSRRGSWATDFPDADLNFTAQFQNVTGLKCDPNGMVLELTDPKLQQQPFIYIAEGGQIQLNPEEVKSLREYLLGGGFLMVDDFWGEAEWNVLAEQFLQVFPDRKPIDLPLTHAVFRCLYELREKPQVPNIMLGVQSQFTGVTWERADAKEAHYRGLVGDDGRLMAIFCHNTDLGDGWERAAESEFYFREFSLKRAYPMGINIVVYALSH
jgi:aldose 1-epimerase